MPTFNTSDGVALSYLDDGDGRPVVLVAGFRAPASSWQFQRTALTAAGYRVLALDRRSHGASEDPPTGHTMARHGADLADFLAAVPVRDAVLVGGSMGASTIWAYLDARGADGVRGMVSVDQTPQMLNGPDWPYGFYGYTDDNRDTYFAKGIPKTGYAPKRSGTTALRMMKAMGLSPLDLIRGPRLSPRDLQLLNDHAVQDWRGVVAHTEVPTLLVAARDSEFWPCEHAGAAAGANPNARSVVVEACGHAVNIEQPDEFNRILLDFLAEL